MAGDLCIQIDSNASNLDLKKINRAYAGSITIDKENKIHYGFWTNPLLKSFYSPFYKEFIIGAGTMTIDRSKMKNLGELFWDFDIPGYVSGFTLYAVRTKQGANLGIIEKLFKEAERIALLKNCDSIDWYPSKYKKSMERDGWETHSFCLGGRRLIKKLKKN